MEFELPPMFLLPMIIAEWLAEEPRTPYELRMKLTEYITQNQEGLMSNDVKILKEWCTVAAQGKDDKASLLALVLNRVEEDTAHFNDWADTRLNGTLDPNTWMVGAQAAITVNPQGMVMGGAQAGVIGGGEVILDKIANKFVTAARATTAQGYMYLTSPPLLAPQFPPQGLGPILRNGAKFRVRNSISNGSSSGSNRDSSASSSSSSIEAETGSSSSSSGGGGGMVPCSTIASWHTSTPSSAVAWENTTRRWARLSDSMRHPYGGRKENVVLPILDRFMMGDRHDLCYFHAMGNCTNHNCRMSQNGHPMDPGVYTDAFANGVCRVIRGGLAMVIAQGPA